MPTYRFNCRNSVPGPDLTDALHAGKIDGASELIELTHECERERRGFAGRSSWTSGWQCHCSE